MLSLHPEGRDGWRAALLEPQHGRGVVTRRWLGLLLGLLLVSGCGTTAAPPRLVRLQQQSQLPAVASDVVPLRIAVAAIISPQGTAVSYQPLLDYLSLRLERPVTLVQRRTYAEVNTLIAQGEVDMAFICTRAYVQGQALHNFELLAAPVVANKTTYASILIVGADSPAQTLADLRGRTFAFTDPLSSSGYLYPRLLLKRLGATPEDFFRRTFFTYSHDDAIDAVATGVADAAAVDSLVLNNALALDPTLHTQIRLIHRSPEFGMPPIVVAPGMRPQLKLLLQEFLLSLDSDPQGLAVLAPLQIDRFVLVDDAAYDGVRALERELDE